MTHSYDRADLLALAPAYDARHIGVVCDVLKRDMDLITAAGFMFKYRLKTNVQL